MTIPNDHRGRLLVFNCHEPWVNQLSCLPFDLDVVVGLKGRFRQGWDEQLRPVPPNARLIELDDALASGRSYDCIIAHNITDLMDARELDAPRLLIIHSSLEGRIVEERSTVPPDQMRALMHRYLELVGGLAVPISEFKAKSWGFSAPIVSCGVEASDYKSFSGSIPSGLRIANHVDNKKHVLFWSFHEAAFGDVPVRLVGHNPNLPGVDAADNWEYLKNTLRSHRFYVHTADPRYEDGFNMALLEAMAAGLPVLGNTHPTSPIRHRVSGYLSDDSRELKRFALELLGDRDRAETMEAEARRTVQARFGMDRFRAGMLAAIRMAQAKRASVPAGSQLT